MVEWFKKSDYCSQLKKHSLRNQLLLSSILFVTKTFMEYWVEINEAFCQHLSANALSFTCCIIACIDMSDLGYANKRVQPTHQIQQLLMDCTVVLVTRYDCIDAA